MKNGHLPGFARTFGAFALLACSMNIVACSATKDGSGFDSAGTDGGGGAGTGTDGSSDPGNSGSLGGPGAAGSMNDGGGGTSTTVTTIYANTDDSLYSLDPMTQAITLVGKFSVPGIADGGTASITDVAVNANGDVYVNTESAVYKVALPAVGGNVALTNVATIAAAKTYFYALAFAPAGAVGADEVLIGGDGNGELWSIDTTPGPTLGQTKHLGSFGKDPSDATKVLALSGDLVFYTDSSATPKGMATIRACATGGTNCSKTSDFLAGIDMLALAAAYKSGTAAATLLSGIYGGSSGKTGPGIGHGEVYGLGAWQGDVYGFTRVETGSPPVLLSIDTTTGAGTVVPTTVTVTNGWSGAGVSSKTTVTVPPPASVK